MTFLFSVDENEMKLLTSEQKKFDILQFRKAVSLGDTIIYQLERAEPEEGEERLPVDESIPQEYSVKIDFLFNDSEGAMKKGFAAVGFNHPHL